MKFCHQLLLVLEPDGFTITNRFAVAQHVRFRDVPSYLLEEQVEYFVPGQLRNTLKLNTAFGHNELNFPALIST